MNSRKIAPKLDLPQSEAVKGQTVKLPLRFSAAGMIETVATSSVQIDQSLVSLAPLETLTIFFMVGLVSGLVVASPWVFYQGWAFVVAGLYKHERRYVKQYLPFSLGLFLSGVFLCFLFVLPITLEVSSLQFNVWLGGRSDAPAQRVDGVRHDPAANLWRFLSNAAGHVVPGADRNPHHRRLPGEAEDRHPGDHGRRGGAHARPGPIQHATPGLPDDPPL